MRINAGSIQCIVVVLVLCSPCEGENSLWRGIKWALSMVFAPGRSPGCVGSCSKIEYSCKEYCNYKDLHDHLKIDSECNEACEKLGDVCYLDFCKIKYTVNRQAILNETLTTIKSVIQYEPTIISYLTDMLKSEPESSSTDNDEIILWK